jgi:hypothetical protein
VLESDTFVPRHIGPNEAEVGEMLEFLGYESLDALIDATVPAAIRMDRELEIGPARTEPDVLAELRSIAGQNQVFRSYIGDGLPRLHHPPVIQRNILENPGWYTAYTPYQAEIAQGRLEALLNFQTMVIDLTGLPIANASLLDEATAAAEAMAMAYGNTGSEERNTFLVSEACHPQTIDVVRTRAEARGIDVQVATGGFGPRRRLRRAPAVPGHDGGWRTCASSAASARESGAHGHRRGGSARAHAAHPAGGVGRGHRGGQHAALRRAARLRRPARGVLRHPRRVQAADPGPDHRGLARLAGSRAAHGAADARAAHPPREGDEQHLHGAGAAGGDRRHVRGLPRPGGAATDR